MFVFTAKESREGPSQGTCFVTLYGGQLIVATCPPKSNKAKQCDPQQVVISLLTIYSGCSSHKVTYLKHGLSADNPIVFL